jgi:subtilase family serine protease
MAADANPITGVWVLATSPPLFPGWYIVGGTSVSSPLMAGIINAAGKFHPSSADLLEHVYSKGQNVYGTGSPFGFNDIKVGYCGPSAGYFTRMGYDWCTGVGSPDGYLPY